MKKEKRRRLPTVHLSAEEFWSAWHGLLAAFAASDDEYIARHGQRFRTDPRCLSWSNGRSSARMEHPR
jgi:hypothetical protein